MNKLILIFALTGIITINSANAQQNIRDRFLVEKIYREDLPNYCLAEYIYDTDNRLIKRILTGEFIEQGKLRPLKYVNIFEYENDRVSKIIFYDSTHFMFSLDTYFFYNPQGQLIRSEEHIDGSIYLTNYHYENGRVFRIDGYNALQYDTIFYDQAGNVTKITRWIREGSLLHTEYFEYDNHPKPNFGIDYLFVFQPLIGHGTAVNDEMGLSQNNMTKGRGNIWNYTYNEYGLPETYEMIFEEAPPLNPQIHSITYKQIEVGISEPVRSKLVVYPNPTIGELRIEVAGQARNDVEIFDIFGRKQKAESRKQNGEKEMGMDISHLPAGVYFLRIGGETVKVVKQ